MKSARLELEHQGGPTGLAVPRLPRETVDPWDFHPDLLCLQERPPAPAPRAVLAALLVLLAALLAWAAVGRLDVVAVAEGKLVPQTYLKIVQPSDQGIVKEILAREGAEVRAGQVLMRMDTALSEADGRALAAEHAIKRLTLRRIDAELSGAPFTPEPDDPPPLFAQVAAQHGADRIAYDSAIAGERSVLERAGHDRAAAEEVRGKLSQVLPLYREQEAAYDALRKDGFVGKILATDKRRERIEKEQDLRAQEFVIQGARDAMAQSERKIAQITAEYRRALQAERVQVTAELEKLGQELAKQRHRHGLLELRAPADGIVKDLATHTAGTVVSPGTVVMTLVPRHEPLWAEVWVSNDDVGFVRTGQPVKLKLQAFQFQRYGMLDGAVHQVSADATDEAPAQQAGAGAMPAARMRSPGYRTLVRLRGQHLEAESVRHPLAPGMQVTAEIRLATRTVIEYLLSPIAKAFREAGRER